MRKLDKFDKKAQRLIWLCDWNVDSSIAAHEKRIAAALRRVDKAAFRRGYNEAGYTMLNPKRAARGR